MGITREIANNQIIGVECSLGLQEYTSFRWDSFPIFLGNVDYSLKGLPSIRGVALIGLPKDDEIITKDGLRFTNPYRSIIDILVTTGINHDVLEAISYMDEDEINILMEYGERYNLLYEVRNAIKESEEMEF